MPKKYKFRSLVTDGAGFISEKTAKIIFTKSKFVSLNAQINAANLKNENQQIELLNELMILCI